MYAPALEAHSCQFTHRRRSMLRAAEMNPRGVQAAPRARAHRGFEARILYTAAHMALNTENALFLHAIHTYRIGDYRRG